MTRSGPPSVSTALGGKHRVGDDRAHCRLRHAGISEQFHARRVEGNAMFWGEVRPRLSVARSPRLWPLWKIVDVTQGAAIVVVGVCARPRLDDTNANPPFQ